jgi:hypothetical protein
LCGPEAISTIVLISWYGSQCFVIDMPFGAFKGGLPGYQSWQEREIVEGGEIVRIAGRKEP